jgi:hypothetical protein
MQPEPFVLFHDPLADPPLPRDRGSAEKRPQPVSRPAHRSPRRDQDRAASRAAALEAVVRDLRTLERETATRQRAAPTLLQQRGALPVT